MMISRLFNYLFPRPKTMLDLAKERILAQTHVLNMADKLDVTTDQFFVVGSLKPKKESRSFESFNVMFTYNNTTVAIKNGEEVLYMFTKPEEILSIRDSIATVYNRGSND